MGQVSHGGWDEREEECERCQHVYPLSYYAGRLLCHQCEQAVRVAEIVQRVWRDWESDPRDL